MVVFTDEPSTQEERGSFKVAARPTNAFEVREGIRALAKGTAKTWGKHGITVNTLAVASAHFLGEDGVEVGKALSLSPPAMGGFGDPATDLAPVLSLLTSPDAHFVTGSTLVLDGGVWMAL